MHLRISKLITASRRTSRRVPYKSGSVPIWKSNAYHDKPAPRLVNLDTVSPLIYPSTDMKLLHTVLHQLHEFPNSKTPKFAIFSHTSASQDDKATTIYQVCDEPAQTELHMSEAIVSACKAAQSKELYYLWVYSLCVDRSSWSELEEGVNGAFSRLEKASVCLVFLHDLPSNKTGYNEDMWKACAYWTRSWTLQELLIPSRVEFFDAGWNHRGSKSCTELSSLISNITGIPKAVLCDKESIWEYCLGERFAWASERCSNQEEDTAYSLAAITGVTLSLRYGEGAIRAFLRLQEAILQGTRDGSIFAWRSTDERHTRGLLAHSTSEFVSFARESHTSKHCNWHFDGSIRLTNKGIEVQSRMAHTAPYLFMEIGRRGDTGNAPKVGILLLERDGVYFRADPKTIAEDTCTAALKTVCVARDTTSHSFPGVNKHLDAEINGSTISPDGPSQNLTTNITTLSLPAFLSYFANGTKRYRSGRPIALESKNPHTSVAGVDEASLCSEEESQEASSTGPSSDVDTESDSGIESTDAQAFSHEAEAALLRSHEYTKLKTEASELYRSELYSWLKSSATGRKKAEEPPQKRINNAQVNQNREQMEVARDLSMSFNLACPFYVFDPILHRDCLIRQRLKSIKHVKLHVEGDHKKPPYCPICWQTFVNYKYRDDHIRANICKPQSEKVIEGIDLPQLRMLEDRDNVKLSVEARWFVLFSTIFPNVHADRSPYLWVANEPRVPRVWDYWVSSGNDCVSKYVETKILPQVDPYSQNEVKAALKNLVFSELVEMALNDSTMPERIWV